MQTLGHYPFKQRLIPRTATNPHFNHKIVWGSVCSCIGLMLCLMFSFSIHFIRTLIKQDFQELDSKLVSIEDYTIRGKIDKEFYQRAVGKAAKDLIKER